MAVATFLTPSKLWRPRLVAATAVAHLAATLFALSSADPGHSGAWLRLDAPGRLLLALVSVLFLACAVYSVGYLRYRVERANRRFCACLLATLGSMSLVAYAQHLGLLWVGIEATTLATAPLIYFNRTARSIEATWKYLVISSIGIALALLGSFFVGYAALLGGGQASLLFSDLLASAPALSKPWLRAGFTLLVVGYGTKLGLAPMHTWKPDAYGEAPGVVGAILAGGLTSCALFALLRFAQITAAAGEGVFADRLLVGMGLTSMGVAAALMLGQRDLKRMLAYSSVEQMGLLALAGGLGAAAGFATLFHLVNNALGKGVLFLTVGNLHRAFGGKTTGEVHGALRRLPLSGYLFLFGLFAVTGVAAVRHLPQRAPDPAGDARREPLVDRRPLRRLPAGGLRRNERDHARRPPGQPARTARRSTYRDSVTTFVPALCLLGLVLLFGLYLPAPLRTLLEEPRRPRSERADERGVQARPAPGRGRGSSRGGARPAVARVRARAAGRHRERAARGGLLRGSRTGRLAALPSARRRPAVRARRGRDQPRGRRVPLAHAAAPAGAPVRARDRRAVRRAPAGHPWPKPVRFQQPPFPARRIATATWRRSRPLYRSCRE